MHSIVGLFSLRRPGNVPIVIKRFISSGSIEDEKSRGMRSKANVKAPETDELTFEELI